MDLDPYACDHLSFTSLISHFFRFRFIGVFFFFPISFYKGTTGCIVSPASSNRAKHYVRVKNEAVFEKKE